MAKYQDWLEPEGLIQIEGWARDGLTDEQICKNININKNTLLQWKKKFPEINNALKKGKEVVDKQVENALLKRALGYSYNETSVIKKDGKVIEQRIVKKEVPGDTTAQIFWLKNRKPAEWRDKKDLDLGGEVKVDNPFKELTTEELRKLAQLDDCE